jgi:hypothetical protein
LLAEESNYFVQAMRRQLGQNASLPPYLYKPISFIQATDSLLIGDTDMRGWYRQWVLA